MVTEMLHATRWREFRGTLVQAHRLSEDFRDRLLSFRHSGGFLPMAGT